jgi:hypothetical protein
MTSRIKALSFSLSFGFVSFHAPAAFNLALSKVLVTLDQRPVSLVVVVAAAHVLLCFVLCLLVCSALTDSLTQASATLHAAAAAAAAAAGEGERGREAATLSESGSRSLSAVSTPPPPSPSPPSPLPTPFLSGGTSHRVMTR